MEEKTLKCTIEVFKLKDAVFGKNIRSSQIKAIT